MRYETLDPTNQFTFTCPVFNAETRISACIKLREKVWRGERVEVRMGCQACMSAGKCPTAHIVQRMAMSNAPLEDSYAAREPRSGKLLANVLERILPVVVTESNLVRFGVSDVERDLIAGANDRILKQLGSAPSERSTRTTMRGSGGRGLSRPKIITPEVQPITSAVNTAAATGDLSAAISQR